jgi:hypothetical protein
MKLLMVLGDMVMLNNIPSKSMYRKPRINVKFTSVKGDEVQLESVEFGGDILAIATSKKMKQPAGTFAIVLINRKDFSILSNRLPRGTSAYDLFRPSSLVDIYINGKEVMLGKIDNLKNTVFVNPDGKPIKSWTITGRDLGAFLIDHKIWYDDNVNIQRYYNISSQTGGLSAFGSLMNLTTTELFTKIINTWMIGVCNQSDDSLNFAPFQYADGGNIQDRFIALPEDNSSYEVKIGIEGSEKTVDTLTDKGALSNVSYNDNFFVTFNMMSNQNDLWTYVKYIANSPWNEVFVDTGDCYHALSSSNRLQYLKQGKVYLIYRPSPYDNKFLKNKPKKINFSGDELDSLLDVNDLIYHEIDDSMIEKKDLSVGYNSAPSAYYVSSSGGAIPMSIMKSYIPPLYDEDKLRRYGYNPIQLNINCIDFNHLNSTTQGKLEDLCKAFQYKAYEWFRFMDKFLFGSFVIRGSEEIRIGHRLNYNKDSDKQIENEYHEGYYYVTGVDHNWSFSNKKYFTTLTVERGVSHKEFGTLPLTGVGTSSKKEMFNLSQLKR